MAINKPEGVVPSDKSVEIFNNIIIKAYNDTFKAVQNGDYSTETRRNSILKQLNAVISRTDKEVQAWIKTQIPAFYEMGMFDANKKINARGDEVRILTTFGKFHEEAVKAISQDAYSHIAQGMKGISNTGERIVSMGARQSILEKIGKGALTGDARRKITADIIKTLEEEGITSLIDRRGRNWSLDRYGEMLARTTLTSAHNAGTINRMYESGYDLVMVSAHFGSCDQCRPFEKMILSISGRNGAFMSLDQAKAMGLFHNNCKHTITPYTENRYLEESMVWDTEKQEYVPFKQLQAKYDDLRGDLFSNVNKSPIPNGNIFTVYRAVNSTNKGATLGVGTYFAFDKNNALKYGDDVKEFTISPQARMLELKTVKDLDNFENEMRKNYGDELAEILDKEGEKGIAKAIAQYAKRLGYDGIISDDEIFGSVVFDTKLLKEGTKVVSDSVLLKDLHLYETAFNKNDIRSLIRLKEKYPNDSRFRVHDKFANNLTISKQEFKDVAEKHKDVLKDIGYDNLVEFQRLVDAGNKTKVKEYISKLPQNSPLVKEMLLLVEYL